MRNRDRAQGGKSGVMAIYFVFSDQGEMLIRHIELDRGAYRNRYSFRQGAPAATVLHHRLAADISAAFARLKPGAPALSLPEYELRLPDLVLYGLSVFRGAEGPVNAAEPVEHVARVARHFGALGDAFRADLSLGWHPPSAEDLLAVEVLSDIVMPLLDLAGQAAHADPAIATGAAHELQGRLRKLNDRRHELQMNLDLLKRFVSGGGKRPAIAAPPAAEPAGGKLRLLKRPDVSGDLTA